jgi:hypothetical protein
VFAFRRRRGDRIKLLIGDGQGFCRAAADLPNDVEMLRAIIAAQARQLRSPSPPRCISGGTASRISFAN